MRNRHVHHRWRTICSFIRGRWLVCHRSIFDRDLSGLLLSSYRGEGLVSRRWLLGSMGGFFGVFLRGREICLSGMRNEGLGRLEL
jgi:hypothetical protein